MIFNLTFVRSVPQAVERAALSDDLTAFRRKPSPYYEKPEALQLAALTHTNKHIWYKR